MLKADFVIGSRFLCDFTDSPVASHPNTVFEYKGESSDQIEFEVVGLDGLSPKTKARGELVVWLEIRQRK
jgi:hypothetical protein